MEKKINFILFLRILVAFFISPIIFYFIVGVPFSGFALYYVYPFPFIILLGIIGSFAIYIAIQKTRFKKFVTKRNINIVCIVIVIIFVIFAIQMKSSYPGEPTEIIGIWHCNEDQVLCTNETCSYMELRYDYTFARGESSIFYGANISAEDGVRTFFFIWEYDSSSKVLTLSPDDVREHWELKLGIEKISDNEMITSYISDNNAPFDAELFDGVTWTKGSL